MVQCAQTTKRNWNITIYVWILLQIFKLKLQCCQRQKAIGTSESKPSRLQIDFRTFGRTLTLFAHRFIWSKEIWQDLILPSNLIWKMKGLITQKSTGRKLLKMLLKLWCDTETGQAFKAALCSAQQRKFPSGNVANYAPSLKFSIMGSNVVEWAIFCN